MEEKEFFDESPYQLGLTANDIIDSTPIPVRTTAPEAQAKIMEALSNLPDSMLQNRGAILSALHLHSKFRDRQDQML